MRNATSTQLQKMQFYQKFFSSEAVFIYLGVILVLLGEEKYKFLYIYIFKVFSRNFYHRSPSMRYY